MQLARILTQVYSKPWAILPDTHKQIRQLIESKLAGNPLPSFDSDDETPPYTIVGNVAVVNVEGVILNKCSALEAMCGATSLEDLRSNLRDIDANENVKSIVLNINSPGGVVTGVPETADLIASIASRKPVYAYSNDTVASAAYWLASQATAIFLSKSAAAGSIGVYLALIDSTEAMDKAGLKLELFKAGTFKAMGLDGNPLTDADRELLQDGVNTVYNQFTSYVTSKRPRVQAATMQGQLFDTPDCLANELIDGVCNELDDLITLANR